VKQLKNLKSFKALDKDTLIELLELIVEENKSLFSKLDEVEIKLNTLNHKLEKAEAIDKLNAFWIKDGVAQFPMGINITPNPNMLERYKKDENSRLLFSEKDGKLVYIHNKQTY